MKTYFKFFMPYFINQNKKKSKLTSIVYHTTQYNQKQIYAVSVKHFTVLFVIYGAKRNLYRSTDNIKKRGFINYYEKDTVVLLCIIVFMLLQNR